MHTPLLNLDNLALNKGCMLLYQTMGIIMLLHILKILMRIEDSKLLLNYVIVTK